MGTLYLVRHGQASFGAENYDQLSELGQRQAQRLGAWWRQRFGADFKPQAVLTGTLQRQLQTWEGMAQGGGFQGVPHVSWPGLNEYDGEAVLTAFSTEPLPPPDTPEGYRQHFRRLRQALAAWMRAETQPEGMPSYADFVRGVVSALDHVRNHYQGSAVIVSSGGPISTAVAQLLQVPPEISIELNLRYRNSAVTELSYTPRRHSLVSYNTLPHLNAPEYDDWVTFA